MKNEKNLKNKIQSLNQKKIMKKNKKKIFQVRKNIPVDMNKYKNKKKSWWVKRKKTKSKIISKIKKNITKNHLLTLQNLKKRVIPH